MAVSTADAAHLLRRSGFGVSPEKLAELTALSTRNAAVDRVLDISANPAVTIPIGNWYTADSFPPWWQMTGWWIERMRTTPTPIVEKLMLLWHNHFVSGVSKVDMGLLSQQHATMRQHATGSFASLAQAMSVDPAMLWYLDNVMNLAGKQQENFGRELMELFTMGHGNYTQTDVVSMTKAWTGYSVTDDWRGYEYRPDWHDSSKVNLFGLSSRSWQGPAALTEILTGSKAVVSSKFIVAKVFSNFAYPIAVTDPIVATLASSFRSSGLDIMALMRSIFRSTAFWSTTARRALVRTPVEWIVASLQATGLSAYQVTPQMSLCRSGQTLFNAPDVSGWKQNGYWLSTSQMWGRSEWAAALRIHAWNAGVFSDLRYEDPAVAVAAAFERFGITDPSPVTRAALEAWCTEAQKDGDDWSVPPNLVHLLCLSPDFQVA